MRDEAAIRDELGHCAAGDYVTQITAYESDRRARATFQDLAIRLAPANGLVFDFGAGPGIDAKAFAEHGLRVEAYDIDARMREHFRAYCKGFIDAGCIVLHDGDYRNFLARARAVAGRAHLIVSNFAPLNLVEDLGELFAAFSDLAAPEGRVLVSILNPYFVGDARMRWWWQSLPRLLRQGYSALPSPQGTVFRRRVGQFTHACRPYFVLKRVLAGRPTRLPFGLDKARSRYLFLVFDKRSASP